MKKQYLSTVICLLLSFIMLIQASASPLDGFITDYEPKIGTQTKTEEGNKQAQNDVCISDETNEYIQPDPMLDEKYLSVFGDLQTKLMSDTSEIELVIVLESNKNYRITNTSALDISFPIQSDDAFFSTAIYDAQNQLLTFSRSKSTSVALSPSQYAIISTYSPVSVTYSTEDGLLFEENDAPALIKTTLERGKNYKLLNTADSDFTLTPENTSLYYEYISYNSDEIFKIGNINQKGALNVLANGYNIITPLSSNSSDISFYFPAEITVEETSRRAYLYTDLTQDKNYKISNNTTEKITVRNPSNIIFDAVVYEGSSQTVQKAVKKDISLNPGSYMTISPTGSDMTVSFINDDNVCVEETNQNVFTRITPEYGKNYKITNTSSYQRKVYKSDSSTAIDYVAYDYSGKTDNVQYMKTSNSISVPSNGYVVVTLSAEKVCQLYFPESGDLTYEETAEPPLTFATLSYGTNYKISASAKTTIYKPTSSQALDMVAYNSAGEVENTYYNKQGGSLTVYANGYNVLTPHKSDVRIYYVSTDSVTIEEYDKAPLKIHTLSSGKTYKITNTTASKLNLYKTDNNLGENSVVYYSDGRIYSTYINRYSSTTTVVGNGYLIISPVESNETDMTVYYVNNGSFLFEEVEAPPLRFSALEVGKSYKIINNSSSEFSVRIINSNQKFDAVFYNENNSATSVYQGTSISTISVKANCYAIVAPSAQNQNNMDIYYANDGSITIEEVDFSPLTYTHLEPGKSYKITNSTGETHTMRFTNSSLNDNMNCDAAVYTNNGNYYTGRLGVTSSVELNSGYYAVFTVNSLALSALEMYYITSDVTIEEQSAPAFSKITLGKDDSAIVVNTSSGDCSVSMAGSYKKGYAITELNKSGDIYYQEYERSASGYTVKTGNKALIFNPNSDAEITVCAPYTEFSLSDGADELSSFAVKPGETYMLPYPGDITLYTSKSATLYDFIDFDSNNKVKRTIAGVYSYIDIRNDSSYITALRTNTSDLMLYYFKDVGTLRFEKTESVTELNKENVLCSWQGEYLGSYSDGWGGTFDVMRNKIIKITECTEDGDIKGVAYIDKHPVATDYVTLAYNFSGRINFATGQITYQGAGEPIYNLTNANFNYLLFTGHIDMANSAISGCANNEARRILSLNRVTKNNDAVTVEGINVTMINSGKEYDVLSETVEFYVGTAATPSFQINIDPNEDITPGYIAIRQNGTDVYYSIGNGSFPYVQMSKFAADEPIYVYVEDEYGRECANLKLTINIIRPVVESNEHRVSGKMSMGGAVLTIFYPDEESNKDIPAKNLNFYFDGKLVTTDEDGFVNLVGIAEDTTFHKISIAKEGCVPYIDNFHKLGDPTVIYLRSLSEYVQQIQDLKVGMNVIYTDAQTGEQVSRNVIKDSLGFKTVSTGAKGSLCEIYVSGIDADEYYIYQSGIDKYKSTDGHFQFVSFDGTNRSYDGPNITDPLLFHNSMDYIFDTEKTVYLRTVTNGESFLYPTNIKIIDGTGAIYFVNPNNEFTEFTFGGMNIFSQTVNYNGDNNVINELFDGTKFSFLENTFTLPIAVTYSYNNHGNSKLKILLDSEAAKLAKKAANGCSPGLSTSLMNATEDIINLTESIREYISNTKAKNNKSFIPHSVQAAFWRDFEFSFDVSGYGETTIDVPIEDYLNSKVAFIDTKLQIDFRPKVKLNLFDGQFFVGGVVPVVVSIGTTLEGRIAPFLYWPGGFGDFPSLSNTKVDLGAKLYLTPKVGVGLKDVASVYIKGNIGADAKWRIPNGYFKLMGYGDMLLGVELMHFFKAETKSLIEGYLPLVNTYPDGLDDGDIANPASLASLPKTDEVGLTDRDYIKSTSKWNGSVPARLMSTNSYSDKLTLQKSINGSAEPISTSCAGDSIKIFLTDDSTRSDSNRTLLVYSVFDEATASWGEPKPIYDNNTADFYPSIAKDGNDLYVVWNDSDKLFGDDVTLEEASAAQGVSFAKYNTETEEFEYLNTVNDDSLGLFGPEATVDNGVLKVVAAANSSNNIASATGENHIKTFTYESGYTSDVKTWITSDKNIHSYSIGKINGQTILATATDTDGDTSTINDMEIFYSHEGSSAMNRLTENEVTDISPCIEDNTIYYYQDGKIKHSAPDVPEKTVVDEINSYEFEIVKNDNGDSAIVYTENDATGTLIKASFSNASSDGWTKPSVVYDSGEQIKSSAFSLSNDGNVETFYTSLNPTTNNYDMHISKTQKRPDIVCEDVSFDESELNEDGTMDITLKLSNRGSVAVNSVDISVFNNSKTLFNEKTNCELSTGETKEITISVPAGDVSKRESFKVTAITDGDLNISNNTKNITLGAVNLCLTNKSVSYVGKSIIATAKITNTSNYDTSARLYVYENDRNENPIYSENIGVIEANSSYDYVLNCEKLVDTGKSSTLYVEVKTADEEYLYSDNYDTVFFTAKKPKPEMYITTSDKQIATVSLANVTDSVLNGKLILCCYNNNKMTKTEYVDLTEIQPNAFETYTFNLNSTNTTKVKAMLWKSLSDPTPLIESVWAPVLDELPAKLRITNADKNEVSVSVTSVSESEINSALVLACYNNNHKLTKLEVANVTNLSESGEQTHTLDISKIEKDSVKAMLWESLDSPKPMAKTVGAPLTE